MIDDVDKIKVMSASELWRNYYEAMDVLMLMAMGGLSRNADYYAAVARVSIDHYFERIEECLDQD